MVRSSLAFLFLFLSGCNYRFFDDIVIPQGVGNVRTSVEVSRKVEPNFLSIRDNIIVPKCIKCHNTQGKASDVPFESYEDLISGVMYTTVISGQPDESSFYTSLLADASKRMPPKSSSIQPLSDEQILSVRIWIENGALP